MCVLKGATEGYEKTIGDRLRQDSKLMVSDVFGAVQNVAHRKSVYIGVFNFKNDSHFCQILIRIVYFKSPHQESV